MSTLPTPFGKNRPRNIRRDLAVGFGGVVYGTPLFLAVILFATLSLQDGAHRVAVSSVLSAWCAAVLAAVGVLFCTYWPARFPGSRNSGWAFALLPMPGLLLGIALASGNPAWPGSWFPLALVIGAEIFRRVRSRRHVRATLPVPEPRASGAATGESNESTVDLDEADPGEVDSESAAETVFSDASIVQQMTRSRTPEGRERIEFLFRAEFPERCATVSVHVPFCPAFERPPGIEAYPLETVPLHVSIPQVLPNGARIDLKRPNARTAEPETLVIAVVADEA